MQEPKQIAKKAIEVIPYLYGIWCNIEDGEPFVNPIVHRRWSEDGERISFMLDSHNFDFRYPNAEMSVVELEPRFSLIEVIKRDRKIMSQRPHPIKCLHCGTMYVEYGDEYWIIKEVMES